MISLDIILFHDPCNLRLALQLARPKTRGKYLKEGQKEEESKEGEVECEVLASGQDQFIAMATSLVKLV